MIFETNVKEITDSLFDDIQKMLIEKAVKDYTKLKCKELLEIVADKAEINDESYDSRGAQYCAVDKNSILNAVNLDEFIK